VNTGAVFNCSFGPRRLDHIRRFQQSDGVDRGGDRHGSSLLADEQTTRSMIERFRCYDQCEGFEAAFLIRTGAGSSAPIGKPGGSAWSRCRASHNVPIERQDGSRVVRLFRGLRKLPEARHG